MDLSKFVTTQGTSFQLNGRPFYFQGTNIYDLGQSGYYTDEQVYQTMQQLAEKGIRVVRFWGFSCSGAKGAREPIIEKISNQQIIYNEPALRHLDLTLDAARLAGLKVILPLVNFESEFCGMDWWVKQVTNGNDKHSFFANEQVKNLYKQHLKTLLSRINTRYQERLEQSVSYRDDPTIMSVEIANEPHTKDFYEQHLNQTSGDLVYNWLKEMAVFIRSEDVKHLISTGEEGYKVSHSGNPYIFRLHWMHNGRKGADFVRNINIPEVSFATTHIYPDAWHIPHTEMPWIQYQIIQDRAQLAHAIGKPIILEEVGFAKGDAFRKMGYSKTPEVWLDQMLGFANQAGYAGTMVWQCVPNGIKLNDHYGFDFNSPEFKVIEKQTQYLNSLNKSAASP
jgi:mannan endo-1,4-beta-mannosidase